MQLEQTKACLGWLVDRTPVKLLWSRAIDEAAEEAAAEGHIEMLAFMLEAVQHADGEHHHLPYLAVVLLTLPCHNASHARLSQHIFDTIQHTLISAECAYLFTTSERSTTRRRAPDMAPELPLVLGGTLC